MSPVLSKYHVHASVRIERRQTIHVFKVCNFAVWRIRRNEGRCSIRESCVKVSRFQDQIDSLFKGSSIGMANGDINHSFLCNVGYLYFFFHSGLPLTSFEKDA